MFFHVDIRSKREFYETTVSHKLSTNPKQSWKYLQPLINGDKIKSGNKNIELIEDNIPVPNNLVCEHFATFFDTAISNIVLQLNTTIESLFSTYTPSITINISHVSVFNFTSVLETQVVHILARLKVSRDKSMKSCIIYCFNFMSYFITALINTCITSSEFPTPWKHLIVIPM